MLSCRHSINGISMIVIKGREVAWASGKVSEPRGEWAARSQFWNRNQVQRLTGSFPGTQGDRSGKMVSVWNTNLNDLDRHRIHAMEIEWHGDDWKLTGKTYGTGLIREWKSGMLRKEAMLTFKTKQRYTMRVKRRKTEGKKSRIRAEAMTMPLSCQLLILCIECYSSDIAETEVNILPFWWFRLDATTWI